VEDFIGLLLAFGFSFESSKPQKGFEFGIVECCPALDFGKRRDIADESKNDDGKDARKGM